MAVESQVNHFIDGGACVWIALIVVEEKSGNVKCHRLKWMFTRWEGSQLCLQKGKDKKWWCCSWIYYTMIHITWIVHCARENKLILTVDLWWRRKDVENCTLCLRWKCFCITCYSLGQSITQVVRVKFVFFTGRWGHTRCRRALSRAGGRGGGESEEATRSTMILHVREERVEKCFVLKKWREEASVNQVWTNDDHHDADDKICIALSDNGGCSCVAIVLEGNKFAGDTERKKRKRRKSRIERVDDRLINQTHPARE